MRRRKSKLEKFAEISTFKNVFEFDHQLHFEESEWKGRWQESYFHNKNPITVELGCGKGEYTVELARHYANRNFIGLELKGNRIWKGARTALYDELDNVAFIRTRADYLENIFAPGELSEIWITFPEPHPQEAKAKKRFTSPYFLEKYKNVLSKDGIIRLKTDCRDFFEYTLKIIHQNNYQLLFFTHDLYNDIRPLEEEIRSVKTFYESIFLSENKPICYLEYRLI